MSGSVFEKFPKGLSIRQPVADTVKPAAPPARDLGVFQVDRTEIFLLDPHLVTIRPAIYFPADTQLIIDGEPYWVIGTSIYPDFYMTIVEKGWKP